MRHDASKEELHFAHSMVETAATFAVIVIQMLHTRMGYVKVRQAVERLEHFDPNEDAHLRSIKTWMWLAVAVGFVLISACVGCFLAFYTYVHLGWTVLSNQSCIVISLAVFGLYSSRVMAAVFRINMDQHKVSVKYCFFDDFMIFVNRAVVCLTAGVVTCYKRSATVATCCLQSSSVVLMTPKLNRKRVSLFLQFEILVVFKPTEST